MKKEIVSFNEDVPGLAKLLELSDEELEMVTGGRQEAPIRERPPQFCENFSCGSFSM